MTERHAPRSILSRRPGLVVAVAVVAGIGLLAAAGLFDSTPAATRRAPRIANPADVVAPGPLSESEMRSGNVGLTSQDRVRLEAGAWVQVADEQGRLEQQYSASRIDPEPDRWLRMEKPRAVMYPSGGRVVTMRADSGRARVPRRALQAGRLQGNVVIQLFRPHDGAPPDLERDEPAVVVKAPEAQFDEVLGEIRCDQSVSVVGEGVSFNGEALTAIIGSDRRSIERLVVERPLSPIVIDLARVKSARRNAAVAGKSGTTAPGAAAGGAAAAAPGAGGGHGLAGVPEAPVAAASAAGSGAAGAVPTSPSQQPPVPTPQPSPAAAPGPAVPDVRWYRLTLSEDVVIQRVRAGRTSVIRGDRLEAIFSMDGKGLAEALAAATDAPAMVALAADDLSGGPTLAGSWPARVVQLSLAGWPQEQGSPGGVECITIHYRGPLVMVPAPDAGRELASADDVRLDVTGRRVEMEDQQSSTRVFCSVLTYWRDSDTIRLRGERPQPLEVLSPRLQMEADNFTLVRPAGTGTIEGPGRMRLGERDLRRPGSRRSSAESPRGAGGMSILRSLPASALAAMVLAAGPAAQGAAPTVAPAAPPAAPPVVPPAAPPVKPSAQALEALQRELEVTWTKGVNLTLAPGGGDDLEKGGALRAALFRGDVKVENVDFELESETLEVGFDEKRENTIRRIVASAPPGGQAIVKRLAQGGSLAAATIDLTLDVDAQGKPIPQVMNAIGPVTAQDRAQTLWTEGLVVTFRPVAADAPARPAPAAGGIGGADAMGNVEIHKVTASRGVQVLLKDGARVFAEGMEGDGPARTVRLTGGDVMLTRQNVVADRLADVLIDEGNRVVTAEGPGRFRYFREPVVRPAAGRIERPVVDGEPTMTAEWTKGMRYMDGANAGGGAIDVHGDVRVRADRSEVERSALNAQSVQLDLRRDAGVAVDAAAAAVAAGGAAKEQDPFGGGTRSIERLVAKGDASLESMTWTDAARTGQPRLFKVAGNHVEYNTITGEAVVVGDGMLLANEPEGAAGAKPPRGGLFDGRGMTRCRWKSRMDMTALGERRFLVTMRDAVELIHSGLRPDDTLTLTCDTLETTIERMDVAGAASHPGRPGPATPAAAKEIPAGQASPLDLGGGADLKRVRGLGRVFVRAPEADVECEEFDYDVPTQIARLNAREGRLVTVLQRGAATPVKAANVVWDLRTGKITIQSASGGASP